MVVTSPLLPDWVFTSNQVTSGPCAGFPQDKFDENLNFALNSQRLK